MGWLSDLWQNITSWIADFIRRSLSTLTKWIDNARVAIAKFKYKLRMTIAGWIQDDTSLLLLSLAAIVSIVLASIVGNMPFVAKLLTAYQSMKDNLKNRMGNIAGILAFQVGLATHRIALIFFPEYQKMIVDLHSSVSAFMDVIGEPIRTASLLLENARTLVYASYTLLGVEDDYKEAQWIGSTQEWVNKLADRIERYTRNPELIMQDIWLEVVQPNLADANGAVSTIYSTLNMLSNKALLFTDNLDNFRVALDDFTGAMPEEIKNAVEKRIAPYTDRLDYVLDEKLIPFTEKTEAVFGVINEIIDDNQRKIIVLAERTTNPLYLLELIDRLSGERRDQAIKLLALLTLEKENSIHKKYASVTDMQFNDYRDRLVEKLKEPISPEVEPVIIPDRPINILQIKYSKESWFVGEH